MIQTGMPYETALQIVQESGAEEFACGYKIARVVPFGEEFPEFPKTEYIWFTLPNGMSIHLYGSQERAEPLILTNLKVCNSTSLFCCKGETWYVLDKLSWNKERVVPTWTKKPDQPEQKFIHLGMSISDAEKVLLTLNRKSKPLPGEIRNELEKPELWKSYPLKNNQLLICVENKHLSRIVISAIKPSEESTKKEKVWIALEMVDLQVPLKDSWFWAFHEEWDWKPGNKNEKELLRRGQRR